MKLKVTFLFSICLWCIFALNNNSCAINTELTIMESSELDTATFGAGCFWCVEAIFQELEGVESVISGYSGGTVENPSYDEVTSGLSGHAEVCQILFKPEVISYDDLLMVFWQTHDPTSLNKQGNDLGPQYRSAVFYHNEEQRTLAEMFKTQLDATETWSKPIVTEITPFTKFYKAENYHQDYFQQNNNAPYCTYVIQPKLDALRETFKDKLKK
ncbi:MAG TPA: peptide-methionine (S)-S-oxide reductase MsrA [Flavobacteriales bacterium]|nr:peptide-methionine (S)-S-oxide reductase MsrA [Flavobacteriales bacterium]